MNIEEAILEKLRILPAERQQEVWDFAEFLAQKVEITSHGWLIFDALTSATALVTGYPLLSKNQSAYPFIQGLNLLPFNPWIEQMWAKMLFS